MGLHEHRNRHQYGGERGSRKPYPGGGNNADPAGGTAALSDLELYTEGATDELPPFFAHLAIRRLLWQEYGVSLPGFSGDDAMDAVTLHAAEAKHAKRKQKAPNG